MSNLASFNIPLLEKEFRDPRISILVNEKIEDLKKKYTKEQLTHLCYEGGFNPQVCPGIPNDMWEMAKGLTSKNIIFNTSIPIPVVPPTPMPGFVWNKKKNVVQKVQFNEQLDRVVMIPPRTEEDIKSAVTIDDIYEKALPHFGGNDLFLRIVDLEGPKEYLMKTYNRKLLESEVGMVVWNPKTGESQELSSEESDAFLKKYPNGHQPYIIFPNMGNTPARSNAILDEDGPRLTDLKEIVVVPNPISGFMRNRKKNVNQKVQFNEQLDRVVAIPPRAEEETKRTVTTGDIFGKTMLVFDENKPSFRIADHGETKEYTEKFLRQELIETGMVVWHLNTGERQKLSSKEAGAFFKNFPNGHNSYVICPNGADNLNCDDILDEDDPSLADLEEVDVTTPELTKDECVLSPDTEAVLEADLFGPSSIQTRVEAAEVKALCEKLRADLQSPEPFSRAESVHESHTSMKQTRKERKALIAHKRRELIPNSHKADVLEKIIEEVDSLTAKFKTLKGVSSNIPPVLLPGQVSVH